MMEYMSSIWCLSNSATSFELGLPLFDCLYKLHVLTEVNIISLFIFINRENVHLTEMHDDMAGSHGLDRDGGMWHLASMVSSAVKSGKEGAESVLKLEAGSIQDVEAKGKLDKRRKRATGRRRR